MESPSASQTGGKNGPQPTVRPSTPVPVIPPPPPPVEFRASRVAEPYTQLVATDPAVFARDVGPLADVPRWIVYVLQEANPKNGKRRKVPTHWDGKGWVNVDANRYPAYMTLKQALEVVRDHPQKGVGFAPKPDADIGSQPCLRNKGIGSVGYAADDQIVLLDIDVGVCVTPDGGVQLEPKIRRLLMNWEHSAYIEVSPSGRGLRLWGYVDKRDPIVTSMMRSWSSSGGKGGCKVVRLDGERIGEVFVTGGFATFTGNAVRCVRSDRQPRLDGLGDLLEFTAGVGRGQSATVHVPVSGAEPLDGARLSGDLLALFNGTYVGDRSRLMVPLLAQLAKQCSGVEQLIDRAWETPALRRYFEDHRKGGGC